LVISLLAHSAIRDKWKKATEIIDMSPEFSKFGKNLEKHPDPHFLKEGKGKLFFSSGDAVHFF
jgi:hypothetical protein